jgi:SAM-dependent methyltransferase
MRRDWQLLQTFLERNLPSAASTFDEGLGIAYERVSAAAAVEAALPANGTQTVLEAPADGLMGIPGMNSVHFARRGAQVTVQSPHSALLEYARGFWERLELADKVTFVCGEGALPFPPDSFDLVWNYCTLEHLDDVPGFVGEMARVSRRYVCAVVQNAYNYGCPIHLAYHLWRREPWDHGRPRWMTLAGLGRACRAHGLKVVARGWFDVVPWFDTFDMHIRGKVKRFMKDDKAEQWYWSALQEGDTERLLGHKLIARLRRFEKAMVFPLSHMFAHHFYIIAETDNDGVAGPAAAGGPGQQDREEGPW